jgi:hypothetical protein
MFNREYVTSEGLFIPALRVMYAQWFAVLLNGWNVALDWGLDWIGNPF